MNDWWKSRSAADDGDVDDSVSRGWLDDFEFDDDEDDATVGDLWSRYGSSARSTDVAIRTSSALKLVQGFVDTFATGDKPYRVTFDESVGTAGTDYNGRNIVISHRPLFDSTIDASTAETILTAMAAHESSHVRYGRNHYRAIKNTFDDQRAFAISNIIEDVRIERRFARDYPGYSGVFAPAIDYVAGSELRQLGTDKFVATKFNDIARLVGALRYPQFVDWAGAEVDRDWWTAWGDRWSTSDKPADHVAAVREALAHLDDLDEARREASRDKGEGDDKQDDDATDDAPTKAQDGTGDAGGTNAETSDEAASDDDANDTTPAGFDDLPVPGCFADGIAAAAQQNDADVDTMSASEAQEYAEQAKALVDIPDRDAKGEVYWSAGGIAKRRDAINANGAASAAIRSAFARSRTGHYAVERNRKTGRIDNRSLTRVASHDYRVFNAKHAPSEGRYNVWLMVDVSGSMNGSPVLDATSLSASLAVASRQVPQLRMSIFGWTTGNRLGGAFSATRVWTSGEEIANIGYLPRLPQGGTPDADVLRWAAKAVRAESRPGETPVIVLASDGTGFLTGDLVDELRRKYGVVIVSTAFGRLDESYQRATFGDNNYLPWMGTIAAMARPIGNLLARVVTGRAS